MAIALQVHVAVVQTDGNEGNGSVLIRSERATTLTVDEGTSGEGIWILAQAKVGGLLEEVAGDASDQMGTAERNMKRIEERGEGIA